MTIQIYLSEKELAVRWNVSYRTLQDWRKNGLLPYTKFGRCIRYAMDDIKAFEAMHTHQATGCFMLPELVVDNANVEAA